MEAAAQSPAGRVKGGGGPGQGAQGRAPSAPHTPRRDRWLDALDSMEGVAEDPSLMERAFEALEGAQSDARDEEMLGRVFAHLRFFRGLPEKLREACSRSFSVVGTKPSREGGSMLVFQQGASVSKRPGVFVLLSGEVQLFEAAGEEANRFSTFENLLRTASASDAQLRPASRGAARPGGLGGGGRTAAPRERRLSISVDLEHDASDNLGSPVGDSPSLTPARGRRKSGVYADVSPKPWSPSEAGPRAAEGDGVLDVGGAGSSPAAGARRWSRERRLSVSLQPDSELQDAMLAEGKQIFEQEIERARSVEALQALEVAAFPGAPAFLEAFLEPPPSSEGPAIPKDAAQPTSELEASEGGRARGQSRRRMSVSGARGGATRTSGARASGGTAPGTPGSSMAEELQPAASPQSSFDGGSTRPTGPGIFSAGAKHGHSPHKEEAVNKEKLGACEAVLGPGDGFGEEALVHSCIVRTSSALLVSKGRVPAVCIVIESRELLDRIHEYIAMQLSPTFFIRPEWCRQVLRIPPETRPRKDMVRFLHCVDGARMFEWLHDVDVMRDLLQSSEYVDVRSAAVVHMEGDPAQHVCILLSGSAQLRKQNETVGQEDGAEQATSVFGGLGGVVAELERGDVVLAPAPWDLGVWPCSAVTGVEGAELLVLPLAAYQKANRSKEARLNGRQFVRMLQATEKRSALDNGRLAAYLSNCILEGVPMDRRVQVAGHIECVLALRGESLSDRVSKEAACVLMSGMATSGGRSSRGAEEPASVYERFLGEDRIEGGEGGIEDVGFLGTSWFADFASCSSVLVRLRREEGWDGGLVKNCHVSALEGLFCLLSDDFRTRGHSLNIPEQHIRPGVLFGEVRWAFKAVADLSAASAETRCVVAVVDSSQVTAAGLQRGVHRVLQAEKVRTALQDSSSRRSDSLLCIAKACGVRLFRQLSRDMMMDLSRHASLHHLPPHTILCREGTECEGVHVVLTGTVFATKTAPPRIKGAPEKRTRAIIGRAARLAGVSGKAVQALLKKILEALNASLQTSEVCAVYSNGDSFGHACIANGSHGATMATRCQSAEVILIPLRALSTYIHLLNSDLAADINLLQSAGSALSVPSHLRLSEELQVVEKVIKRIPLLAGRSSKVIGQVCKRLYVRHLEAGEVCQVEGEEISRFCVVLHGGLELYSGMQASVRMLYDVRLGSIMGDDALSRVCKSELFPVFMQGFRAENMEGVLFEANRDSSSAATDPWEEKLYRIEADGDFSVFEHPAARAGLGMAARGLLAGNASAAGKPKLLNAALAVSRHFSVSSQFGASVAALEGGGTHKPGFKRLGNLSADVLRCDAVPPRQKPATVNLAGGKTAVRGGKSDAVQDSGGRAPICTLGMASSSEMTLYAANEQEAARWLGSIVAHMTKGGDYPLGARVGLLREGMDLGQAMLSKAVGVAQVASISALASVPTDIVILERADYDAACAEGRAAELLAVQESLVKLFGFGSLGLSSEMMEKIAALAERKVFKRGQTVFSAGAKATHMLFLVRGQCVLQRVVHTETQVRTFDGSLDFRHGTMSSRGTRKDLASVTCLAAPSVLGSHAKVATGKVGGGEYGTYALGATAMQDSEGFLLALGDLEALDPGETLPLGANLLGKLLQHVSVISQVQKGPILGVSKAVERTFWVRETNVQSEEEEEAVEVVEDDELKRGSMPEMYNVRGEGTKLDSVARLGDKYKSTTREYARIPNKNKLCRRCHYRFDDILERCSNCGKYVPGSALIDIKRKDSAAKSASSKKGSESDGTAKGKDSRSDLDSSRGDMRSGASRSAGFVGDGEAWGDEGRLDYEPRRSVNQHQGGVLRTESQGSTASHPDIFVLGDDGDGDSVLDISKMHRLPSFTPPAALDHAQSMQEIDQLEPSFDMRPPSVKRVYSSNKIERISEEAQRPASAPGGTAKIPNPARARPMTSYGYLHRSKIAPTKSHASRMIRARTSSPPPASTTVKTPLAQTPNAFPARLAQRAGWEALPVPGQASATSAEGKLEQKAANSHLSSSSPTKTPTKTPPKAHLKAIGQLFGYIPKRKMGREKRFVGEDSARLTLEETLTSESSKQGIRTLGGPLGGQVSIFVPNGTYLLSTHPNLVVEPHDDGSPSRPSAAALLGGRSRRRLSPVR